MAHRPPGRDSEAARPADLDALTLFSVMWALAAVWHLLGNGRAGSGWAESLLAVSAGLVIWRPASVSALALLAVSGLATVWEEAPILGNHWLLAGFVNLAIVMAVAAAALRRRWSDRTDLASRLLPVARLCLLGFYGFTAFAKLNSGYFDRSTSCAVHYFREASDSVGLASLQLDGAAWLEWMVIGGIVAVELSIPVMLVVRRTRHLGVVLGLAFHSVLAIDRGSQVFGYASVLTALMVLFLPPSAGTWVAERIGSMRARLALVDERLPLAVHITLTIVPALAGLAAAIDLVDADAGLELGWWPWQILAVTALVATVVYLRQRPLAPAPRSLRPHHPLFLLVPLLVVANGLTPYLELKTGYAWNLYSNLRTVDGESNHFLVTETLPLTGEQDDLVRIIDTDDAGLARYATGDYALTWRQLRAYAAEHPGARITYERGEERVALRRADDRPELVEPVAAWRRKLQPFRSVDLRSPERCQTTFGPAR